MKYILGSIVLFVITSLALPQNGAESLSKKAREEISANMEKLDLAFSSNDIKSLKALLAPNYYVESPPRIHYEFWNHSPKRSRDVIDAQTQTRIVGYAMRGSHVLVAISRRETCTLLSGTRKRSYFATFTGKEAWEKNQGHWILKWTKFDQPLVFKERSIGP